MAINQGKVLTSIEKVVRDISEENFIFDFLLAYGFPKASVTRLQKGDKTRNVAHEGDIAIKKQIYFKQVPVGSDLENEVEALSKDELISRHDIRFLIVTDFQDLAASDLAAEETLNIPIDELDKNYTFFLPLAGFEKAIIHSEHPADIRASEKMGRLFDLIKENNDLTQPEDIHALNVFLTRLLFCFYAEDTGIFEEQQMTAIIKSTTQVDGSDLDEFLYDLFTVLNLPEGSEQRNAMPAHLQAFPYVNGGLFKVDEPVPAFSKKSRRMLLECGDLSWAEINPDIFGSMFQAVIDEEQRGNLGQHYTSVSNIMKVIQPLFMDTLWEDLEKAKGKEKALKELLLRLQEIRVFDPACGSGNFLIIAYKEMRKLEMAVIDELNKISIQGEIYYSGIKLSQFYGIEIDDFAHEIGVLSLILAEHQMNRVFEEKFGFVEPQLPIKTMGNIVCGNSLLINWEQVCPIRDQIGNQIEVYVCGNPPYLGARVQFPSQKKEMESVFCGHPHYKDLDYVAAWFVLGSRYIREAGSFAFVSTSSLFQGEQVGYLWNRIRDAGQEIFFCYEPFPWTNNAKQAAGVHCTIVGICPEGMRKKYSYISEYRKKVENLSPYLVEGTNLVVESRKSNFDEAAPKMLMGNMPRDGGHLILTEAECDELLRGNSEARKLILELYGSKELLSGTKRYAIWIEEDDLDFAQNISEIFDRISKVKEFRLASKAKTTNQYAKVSHQFAQRTTPPTKSSIVIPAITSGRRDYVPIFLFDESKISTNKNYVIPDGSLYDFGLLQSAMHFDWMRVVVGRNGSGYSYSINVVYNTFPRPIVDEKQREEIAYLAEEIVLLREEFPDKTPAQLYDPELMPNELLVAHRNLDEAVDRLYREKSFKDASDRFQHLLSLYEENKSRYS